jgi:hypothetical protein
MDSSAFLLSVLSGFLGAALLFVLRELILIPSRTKEQRKRKQVQRQLEKLYSPLFMLVKYGEFILTDKKPTLTYIGDEGKKDLDSTILNYGYLADDELMKLLPQVLGPAFYDARNMQTVQQMLSLILGGYEKLRKQYFSD